MSLFDNDITLPGVVTEIISDYSSGYDTSQFGTTDGVLVIGTAFNGPVGKVVEVYSPEHGQYIFGQAYNSTTRQETSLVLGIQDAWDRGCRTIYACRVSGKEIYKDYQLAADSTLKLRVAGQFPSNSNKKICMVFNKDAYDMSVTIFKPAERATIAEKRKGMVESADSIISETIDLSGSGLSFDDDLTDLISTVNNYTYNNVLKLSIVDKDGNDVTLSSSEAKGIKIGDMFPGLYTIGRDANAEGVTADTKLSVVFDTKPYTSYTGAFYKKLSLNTNVAQDLPLYSEENNLNEILGISSINEYDFLSVADSIDKYFVQNNIDYEEVDLNAFDLYKKLGSGFAINAGITVDEKVLEDGTKKLKVRVKEVTDKATKKSEIADGIYSTLENVPCRYRVLTGVYAEQQIKGSLPKAKEFEFAKAQSAKVLNGSISIAANVDSKDLAEPKNYKISFESMTEDEVEALKSVKSKLYTDKTVRQATLIDFADLDSKKQYKEGDLFLVTNATSSEFTGNETLLYTYNNGSLVSLHKFDTAEGTDLLKNSLIFAGGSLYICKKPVANSANASLVFTSFEKMEMTDINNKEYVLIGMSNGLFQVAEVKSSTSGEDEGAATTIGVKVLGTIDQVLTEDEDVLLTAIADTYNDNNIVIRSNQFDFLTIDEIVDLLNNDIDFSQLFTISVEDVLKSQEVIDDIKTEAGFLASCEFKNKVIAYDTTKLIPFRTDDNFARQLAQHCEYTTLKTSPTHGMIGTKLLLDTSPDSISNRVSELVALDLSSTLVAKRGNGSNMLDRNNMPYPIGKKISVITGQYVITDGNDYSTLCNMAAGYAGMVSCLALDQSSTCQPITVPDLSYEFTNYQLGLLTNSGFVTIKKSYTKGWVITDGITMAPVDSIYRRLSASRIADAVQDLLRGACEPYIGKQNNLTNQNSLRSAIKSVLDTISGTLINSYDFELVLDKNSTKLGVISINHAIVPIYEIKEIKNNITITE